MADEFGLVIESAPWNFARIIGIVLERKKHQVLHPAVLSQILQEANCPRDLSAGIGPDFDVLVHALKRRTAELERGIEAMKRSGPLQIERRVVLGKHVLPVSLLAHFDV